MPRLVKGFTLVELVVVIALMGVVGTLGAGFIARAAEMYRAGLGRAELLDEANGAIRRIVREVAGSLPNSVRATVSADGTYLELIPNYTTGRYRAFASVSAEPTGNNPLEFASSPLDTSFQVLGRNVTVPSDAQLVIYNLGTSEADAYSGNNRRTPVSGTSLSTIAFTATSAPFPFDSPDHRVYVVAPPVTFHCAASGNLNRYEGYGWRATQPTLATLTSAGAAVSRLATTLSACGFEIDAGLSNLGAVLIKLSLTRNGETVTLIHQVNVDGTP